MKKTPRQPVTHSHTYLPYIIGFVVSLLLTIQAYVLVVNELLEGGALLFGIGILAMVQVFVQLIFFLHMSEEHRPRWRSMTLWFMLLVAFIIVAGSIWIMNNLNYQHGSPNDIEQHLLEKEGFYR